MPDLARLPWVWLRHPVHRDWSLWAGLVCGVLWWAFLVRVGHVHGTEVLWLFPFALVTAFLAFTVGVGFVRQLRASFGRDVTGSTGDRPVSGRG